MTRDETRAIVTIALMAANADGVKDDREREQLRALATRFAGIDVESIHQLLQSGQVELDRVAAPLAKDPKLAQLAFETAVGVADADGAHTAAEGAFLERLAATLGLPPAAAHDYIAKADAIAAAPGVPAAPLPPTIAGRVEPDAAELDKRIVDASITNAALELLPESLASMAILPLQVRLVYRIGQAYGYQLDSGHIKEFIATLGVGLTGQYLEQFGRKLLGGVLGGLLGGLGGAAGRQAASSGMAFAATWAIGQVAKHYYAGGRTLDAAKLKAAFDPLLAQGKDLFARYTPAIDERMRSIDVRNLPQLIGRV